MRVAVELSRAASLLNHGPTTLVSSAHQGRRNVMAAAWAMPLDFRPPKVAVVIAQDTLTRELVDGSGEFVLSLPPVALAELTWAVGHASGRDEDKFARHGLATERASVVGAPLIEGCLAWLECLVIAEPRLATEYDLFLAEVVAAWADDRVWAGNSWSFPSPELRTIHHVAKGAFFATGAPFLVGR